MRKFRMTPSVLILLITTTVAVQAADAKAGQAVYEKSCKSCHGLDGTPNPGIAKALKVDMQDLKSQGVQGKSDDELAKVITAGTGKMKPVASVTGDSVANVVAYVRTLKK
jgi:mono/diheme cytochrome c family protein